MAEGAAVLICLDIFVKAYLGLNRCSASSFALGGMQRSALSSALRESRQSRSLTENTTGRFGAIQICSTLARLEQQMLSRVCRSVKIPRKNRAVNAPTLLAEFSNRVPLYTVLAETRYK